MATYGRTYDKDCQGWGFFACLRCPNKTGLTGIGILLRDSNLTG